jgi:hypothetical protein
MCACFVLFNSNGKSGNFFFYGKILHQSLNFDFNYLLLGKMHEMSFIPNHESIYHLND